MHSMDLLVLSWILLNYVDYCTIMFISLLTWLYTVVYSAGGLATKNERSYSAG